MAARAWYVSEWVAVGVLLALVVAALPSIGWFIAPFAIASFFLVRRSTKGRGMVPGLPIGFAVVAITLTSVALATR